MKTQTFDRHPLSSFFYDMQPEEFESLKNSISQHGVLNPIIIHEDMILDGWHRYKACQELDIECPLVYFTDAYPDTDERDFVIAQNKERKTLTKSQIALAVVKVTEWVPLGGNQYDKNDEGAHSARTLTEDKIAEKSGTSKRTVQQAKQVVRDAVPEVQDAVAEGKIGLSKAAEISKLPKDEQLEAISKPLPKKESPKTSDSSESNSNLEIEVLRQKNQALTEELQKNSKDLEELRSFYKRLSKIYKEDVEEVELEELFRYYKNVDLLYVKLAELSGTYQYQEIVDFVADLKEKVASS